MFRYQRPLHSLDNPLAPNSGGTPRLPPLSSWPRRDMDLLDAQAFAAGSLNLADSYQMQGDNWGSVRLPALPGVDYKGTIRRFLGVQPPDIRVAIFGSYYRGISLIYSVSEMEAREPGKVMLVGVATDATGDDHAKINRRGRVWQYVEEGRRQRWEGMCASLAACSYVPCYSGKLNAPVFRANLLRDWHPDVILVGTYGQKVPHAVHNYPTYGTYNFHPSDLSRHLYPGPNPFFEMISARERFTRVTVHEMSDQIDGGRVVGVSPLLRITPDPEQPMSLQEQVENLHRRTAWVAGRMAKVLLNHIAAQGKPASRLDFSSCFSDRELSFLMRPLRHDECEPSKLIAA